MALSAFTDKKRRPTDDELRVTLGAAASAWLELINAVAERIDPIEQVWGFTSGWGLRLRQNERVILYMTPQDGQFLASLALGEKAVAATAAVRLPAALREAIAAAPRYAEGRGVRVIVKRAAQVAGLAALAEIKSRH